MKYDRLLRLLFYGIVILLAIIIVLMVVNSYFGWYADKKWKIRQSTISAVYFVKNGKLYYPLGYSATESVNRGVFVKQLAYKTEPDSLIQLFPKSDTLFYIERGYRWKKHSLMNTQILTDKETKFPFQLVCQEFCDDGNRYFFEYIKENNIGINDSLNKYYIKVKLAKSDNDTLVLQMKKGKENVSTGNEPVIGIVKVFNKNIHR